MKVYYETCYINDRSDRHGEPCERCQIIGNVCSANIYVDIAEGERRLFHSCESIECIRDVLDYHVSDRDALIEISTAPLIDSNSLREAA